MDTKTLSKLKKIQKEGSKMGLIIPNPFEVIAYQKNTTPEDAERDVMGHISKYRFVEVSPENKTVYMVVNSKGTKFKHYGSRYAFVGEAHYDVQDFINGKDVDIFYLSPKYKKCTCQQMVNDISDSVYSDMMYEEPIDSDLVVLPNVYHADKLKKKNDIVIEGFIPKGCPFIRVNQSWSGYSAEIITSVFVPKRIVEDTNPEGFETPQYDDDMKITISSPTDTDAITEFKKKDEERNARYKESQKPENKWKVQHTIPEVMKFLDSYEGNHNAYEISAKYYDQYKADIYVFSPFTITMGEYNIPFGIQHNDLPEKDVVAYLEKGIQAAKAKTIKNEKSLDDWQNKFYNTLLLAIEDFKKTL